MFFKLPILLSLLVVICSSVATDDNFGFIYNGFPSANLSLDGIAEFTNNGVLQLTNKTRNQNGHAFYPNPISFKNSSNGHAFSFSTTFVFAIHPKYSEFSGHGMAFVIAPTRGLPLALPNQYLGLFNERNDGNFGNHVFAVEIDTQLNEEFLETNDNHIGIDINGLKSVKSAPAGYYENQTGDFKKLTLTRQKIQVWVEYNGEEKQIKVTLAPFNSGKPISPLISLSRDLSTIFNENMFVGFSSANGKLLTSHYVLGWSFKMNGQAQELLLSKLPKLPRIGPKKRSMLLTIGLPFVDARIWAPTNRYVCSVNWPRNTRDCKSKRK
ncbi:L-type lectin-domain containing receptor kinase IV.1-like [Pistacia vera]|uniref:L-type lectin-domain containing receptor kinase IV.1-like n=1 Tax=Pistacia vera TaxID=55513 RepID=UPI001263641F|nr:L-type lectin-domain containing receptor kinase IV.1-like [Pistacia vera]